MFWLHLAFLMRFVMMWNPLKKILVPGLAALLLFGCQHNKSVFQSDCNANSTFKKVTLNELVTHPEKYNKLCVEVTGKYKEGFEQSALFNDSLFADHSVGKAIWVEFSPDCPLYLAGTRTGLFEYHDGEFTQINNKLVTIRGRINRQNRGHLKQYQASIGQISFIKL